MARLLIVTLLLAIGIAAGIARAIFPTDLATRAEPFRQEALARLQRHDPSPSARLQQVAAFDRRYADHRAATLLHVVPGTLFLIVASMQFSRFIRSRYVRVHRWTGRLLLIIGSVIAVTGLFFGVAIPFGGMGERVIIATVSVWFLIALSKGFIAIRNGRQDEHRRWMIRAFALALAVSVVRIIAAILDLTFVPAGYSLEPLFVVSLATGWLISACVAEVWISHPN
ncbi:MAG TPA: DUF2306 domain-containing protein [Thermoanaerobaculia bacterium]|nr:DUF2306 domain-containing protein [Thermoanaerobaculia bacterium]